MQPRWKVLIVVSVAVFMASLDLFIVNIAFPDIRADFDGTSVAGVSWVLNAYAIVFAALLVPAGRLADRVGRKRTFLTGLGVFLLGSGLAGLAPSVETLVAARVLQAAGAALLVPTSLALLLPEFPPKERAAAIGIWAAVGGVAAAAGPPLGGLLVEGSWRVVFLVNIPVGLGAAWFAVRLLRESSEEAPGPRPDLLGTLLFTGAIGALALGFVQAPEWGWGDERTLAAFAAAVVGLVLFLRRSGGHPAPVLDLDLLRVRPVAAANASAVLFNAAFGAMLLASVLFLTGVEGDPVITAGLKIAPGPVLAATFAVVSSRRFAALGAARLAATGSAVFAAGSLWWLWQADAGYADGLLPGLLLTGVGVGFVLPSLANAATASLPPARFATGSAVLTMSRQLGIVIGVAILVAILAEAGPADFDGAWLFMAIASGLASVGALAIGPVGVAAPAVAPAAAEATA